MEELLIKYLDNNCNAAELQQLDLLFKNDPALKSEIDAMRRVDLVFSKKFSLTPDPKFVQNLKSELSLKFSKKKDYTDFIIPGLFVLGSIIYMIFNLGNMSTESTTIDITSYSLYINIGFFSMAGILGLYYFDQFLSHRKKNNSLRVFSF